MKAKKNNQLLHLPRFLQTEPTDPASATRSVRPPSGTGPGQATIPGDRPPPPPGREQNLKIARLLVWFSWAAFLVTAALFVAAFHLDELLLFVGGAATTGVGVFMLSAADALRTGKERRGGLMLSIALLMGAAAYTAVIPGGASALALLPVIIVAVVLPFVRGPALKRFLIASWGVGFALVAVNMVWHPPSGLPASFTIPFRVAGFAAILALALTLLYHHHDRLMATVEQAQSDAAALQQAHEELKRSDETKTRFLNSAAHELRTPLTPVLIQLELLQQHAAVQQDPRLKHSTQLINRNMHRLKAHVDELLDIARLQSDRFSLRFKTTALDPLLQDAEESFRQVTDEKGIRFDVKSTPGIRLQADPNRLMQVIFNLLSNAVKATPAGGRIVLFSETDGESCTIRVTDTGLGISQEDQKRLFQPFEQLASREHEKDGAGLGLFISRNIVEAHRGQITCESPGPGKGATFTVTIPITLEQEVEEDDGADPPVAPRPGETPLDGTHARTNEPFKGEEGAKGDPIGPDPGQGHSLPSARG